MIHGFNKKELIGKNALELFSPKDLERAKEGLKETLKSESVKNVEYTLLTKDGREFPVELSACLIRDASGNPLSFVAITKDITERKKAEKNLKEKIEALERYKRVTVDRELKMIELKKEINDLCRQLNQKPRYEKV
jgi:PAS domain S-box-containing protein